MAPSDVPGLTGTDPSETNKGPRPFPITGDGMDLRPIGTELKAGDHIIKDVTKDWDVTKPRTTPEIVVHGKTLEDVGKALMALKGEWGQGGGDLRNDPVDASAPPEVTVTLHANLVRRIVKWAEYAQGSTKGKANWDAMVAKLGAHEDKHVSNAVEAAEQCSKDLKGKEILEMPGIVTKANAALLAVQQALDKATESGTKPGVPFGDVILDTDES